MGMEAKNKVNYRCQACGAEFEVTQGSRRHFCNECLASRIRQGRPKARPSDNYAESS